MQDIKKTTLQEKRRNTVPLDYLGRVSGYSSDVLFETTFDAKCAQIDTGTVSAG
jgi:hypothetical protein